MSNTIIKLPAATKKAGISRSLLYKLEAQGDFPKKIKLSPRAIGFLESEVDDWITKKAENRNVAEV